MSYKKIHIRLGHWKTPQRTDISVTHLTLHDKYSGGDFQSLVEINGNTLLKEYNDEG